MKHEAPLRSRPLDHRGLWAIDLVQVSKIRSREKGCYHWNFIRKWLQESNIFKHPLVHPWPKKCISKGHKTIQLVKKSACAKDTKEARARATVE
jgi:hypothetical protein